MKNRRREFLKNIGLLGAGVYAIPPKLSFGNTPLVSSNKNRPQVTHGVWSGDVTQTSAILCARTDRPSRMLVEVSLDDTFRNAEKSVSGNVLSNSDFVGKAQLRGLPSGEKVFYRIQFEDLQVAGKLGAPVVGSLRTAPTEKKDISFAWSGDTAGQGFGIDVSRGGMKTYQTIYELKPDFFYSLGRYLLRRQSVRICEKTG